PLIAFLLSSFSSAGVDVLLFFLIVLLLGRTTTALLIATISSRMLSGFYNYHMNRKVVFHSHGIRQSFWKYSLLFVSQLGLSWVVGTALNTLITSVLRCKVIVDSSLFWVSFTIQSRFVFSLTLLRKYNC